MTNLKQAKMGYDASNRQFWSAREQLAPLLVLLLSAGTFDSVEAAVTVSSSATQGMSCSGGVCSPTASQANLSVTDLENYLASGNLTVTTTGSAQATDIEVNAGISWVSSSVLSLAAYRSIIVNQPIAVNGTSGLSIQTNNGGSGGIFSFSSGANVSVLDLTSSLTINGASYALENSVGTLASGITANPNGNYALANNYNASPDGIYSHSPIKAEFSGNFEGLGNTISNLSVRGGSDNSLTYLGLFSNLGAGNQPGGAIENIVLQNVNIGGKGFIAGGLVANNTGSIKGSFVTGSVSSAYKHNGGGVLGLLVGSNAGTITLSGAAGVLTSNQSVIAGGLTGANSGPISLSFANCTISGGSGSSLGGLAGQNGSAISQSYGMGSLKGGSGSDAGGLVGVNFSESMITQAYSTTAVAKFPNDGSRGGLLGIDFSPAGSNSSDYWDTTTSDVPKLNRGAGNVKNDPGITGLTNSQLQAGLPSGFDPTIWSESSNINGGLPYLMANPPRWERSRYHLLHRN